MTYYAFLFKRPHDKQAWAAIWAQRELAENEPYRVGPVVEVQLHDTAAVAQEKP